MVLVAVEVTGVCGIFSTCTTFKYQGTLWRILGGNLTQTVANKEGHARCKDDGTPLQDQTIHGTWTGMIN